MKADRARVRLLKPPVTLNLQKVDGRWLVASVH
jgi:hypothetical protein